MAKRFNEIEDAKEAVEAAQRSFLTAAGWRETCDHPGSYWLWQKEFAGRIYVLERSFAVSVQRSADFLRHPDARPKRAA
jgi:hypothetical protein